MRERKREGHPAQLDLRYNPSYIPDWLYEKYGGRLHNHSQPQINENTPAAVIIPLRDSQAYINKVLNPLLRQTHQNLHIYLVGNVGDKTWAGISEDIAELAGIDLTADAESWDPEFFKSPVEAIYIRHGTKISIVEVQVPKEWKGRDSNLKRNIGSILALYHDADYLFYTDAKITRTEEWVAQGLGFMSANDVGAVAGEMIGTESSLNSFWGRFTDDALIRRNPRFGNGYFLNKENFGDSESLPITATLAVSGADFVRAGGFDLRFTISYEDYSFAWRLALAGVLIFCTSAWTVEHEHRQGLRNIEKEYERSGGGAAMLYYLYPECPFGQKRVRQVRIVSFAFVTLISVAVSLLILGQGTFLLYSTAFSFIVYFMVGLTNVAKASFYIPAFVFPALSALFILAFNKGFIEQLFSKGGGGRVLQTIWSLTLRNLS